MGTPFVDLPTGCPPAGFNPANYVPPGFTLCTLPSLPLPTLAPTPFQIEIVDNIPPPYCPCIPSMAINKVFSINMSRADVYMKFTQKSATVDPDCCDPDLLWTMDLNIPCMPLYVTNSTGTMAIKLSGPGVGVISHNIFMSKMLNTCSLDLQYDIKIPCMPLKVTHSTGTMMIRSGAATKVISHDIHLSKMTGTCGLNLEYDIKIPCMPLKLTRSTGTMLIRSAAGGHDISHDIHLTRIPGTCGLDLEYDIKIPCLPLSVTTTFTASIETISHHEITATATGRLSGTCRLILGYDLRIPCMPLGITALATASWIHWGHTAGRPHPITFHATGYMETHCVLHISYNLQLDCVPFDISHRLIRHTASGIWHTYIRSIALAFVRRTGTCLIYINLDYWK